MNPESDKILVKIRRGSIPMVISEYLFKKGGIFISPHHSSPKWFQYLVFLPEISSLLVHQAKKNTKNTFFLKLFSINV